MIIISLILLLSLSVSAQELGRYGTSTSSGSSASEAIDVTPDTLAVSDEFIGGTTTSGQIGEMGWETVDIENGGVYAVIGGSGDHFGIYRATTQGTTNDGAAIVISSGSVGVITDSKTDTDWSFYFIFKINTISDIMFRIGLMSGAVEANPANGIFCRFYSDSSDSKFKFVARNSGSQVVSASSVTADTDWHKLKVSSSTAGTVDFSLDDETAVSITASQVTNNGIRPAAFIVTKSNANIFFEIDYFAYYRVTTR